MTSKNSDAHSKPASNGLVSKGTALAHDLVKNALSFMGNVGGVKVDHTKYVVKAPDLPPGVVPANPAPGYMALDSSFNQSIFQWCNNGVGMVGFPGYQFLAQLSQRSEYRAPAETTAQEMTRHGIELDSTGEGDNAERIDQLEKALREFNVMPMLRKCVELDYLFGRAQIYIAIKGQTSDEHRQVPLLIQPESIKVGSLEGFKVIEPMWTTPFSYNSTDPTQSDFYKPTAWYVLGKKTHATRLLTFIGREMPDTLKAAYNFGGISMSQLIEPYVIRWLKTVDGVNKIINNFSIIALKTNLAATLSVGGDAVINRATLFTQNRDNQGLMMLDKDTEELEQIAVPLSGLHELQAQAQEHQAAPTHIPLVKLTGITPSGLNASSEGEIQVWYDFVRAMQELFFRAHLTSIINILQLHLFGDIDETITFSFVPLEQMDGTELAQIRKSDSDRATAYIASGVIAPEEERERLSRDPLSGYQNLSSEAPEPPDLTNMSTQHELGEESADNAHERSEESADNAAKREKANSENE